MVENMNKCQQCGSQMQVRKYEHVSDVAGVVVHDSSGTARTCVECGAVELSLDQMQRYEQRAAATVLRHVETATGPMVRYARRAMGMTQVELSAALGSAPETISRWENGAIPIPRVNQLALIALLDTAFYAPAEPAQETAELSVPICAA
jgi:putative zinc finger/helix-turn-helix YgiT family protein